MAKEKKTKAVKASKAASEKLERTYNIPLRKEWLKVPKYQRAKKAVTALRQFLSQHMKSKDIRIGRELNKALWARGIQSPPHHVRVTAVREDDKVFAELFGVKVEPAKAAKKAPDKKQAAESEAEVTAELAGEEEKPAEAKAQG